MSFLDVLKQTDFNTIKEVTYRATAADVARTLAQRHWDVADLPVLLSPAAADYLEQMATIARQITLLRFGSVIRLYAPLYISNECVNACAYCGFNRTNNIERLTLTIEQALQEADALHAQGFRHLLLVSGEHREKVPPSYLEAIVRRLSEKFAAVTIEVYPLEENEYRRLGDAGVTGIAIYQETYDRAVYRAMHNGPKADFDYRLLAPERAGRAGYREIGIGALLGLTDFRIDISILGHHAAYLMKTFWKAQVAISFPRLRAACGGFVPPAAVSDRDLAQIVFALRMALPDVDLVLSTREKPAFRDGMAGLGITRMSAGSKTKPGGYSLSDDALEQFEVADTRPPAEVAAMLYRKNLEPVWKDFDRHFLRG
ncbi:MAG: 2-iminoacetate synthase ThiH [Desulfobacterota bacterium]|nr:2-iminoacetate synthase ThiH [Thermodesulfobacteriota bacterium]